MAIDLIVVATLLILQPLIALVYLYVTSRLVMRYASRESGAWVDRRIDKAKEAADELARGER